MTTEAHSLQDLHKHKQTISGFRGERSCRLYPGSNSGERVAIKVRPQTGKAFVGGIGKSTAFTCPLGYLAQRNQRRADTEYILKKHEAEGGIILAGSFGMKVRDAYAPKYFYHPKESFRTSTIWEKSAREAAENDSVFTLREALKSEGWEEFLAENRNIPSYQEWDLNRRLDASSEAISYMFTARDIDRLMKRLGLDMNGYIVATELEVSEGLDTSTGAYGWRSTRNNVHIHFLLLLHNDTITQKTVRALLTALHARWKTVVKKHGFSSTLAASSLKTVGVADTDVARVAGYITKGVKNFGDDTRLGGSFWDALRASLDGDLEARTFWRNLEGAARNRRLFRISQSLHKKYGVVAERERRTQKWQSAQGEPETIVYIDRGDWFLTTVKDKSARKTVLTLAEEGGAAQVKAYLDDKSITYHLEQGVSEKASDSWLLRQAGLV